MVAAMDTDATSSDKQEKLLEVLDMRYLVVLRIA